MKQLFLYIGLKKNIVGYYQLMNHQKKSSSTVSILDIHNSNHLNDRGENDTATSSENDYSKDTTKIKQNKNFKLSFSKLISMKLLKLLNFVK